MWREGKRAGEGVRLIVWLAPLTRHQGGEDIVRVVQRKILWSMGAVRLSFVGKLLKSRLFSHR